MLARAASAGGRERRGAPRRGSPPAAGRRTHRAPRRAAGRRRPGGRTAPAAAVASGSGSCRWSRSPCRGRPRPPAPPGRSGRIRCGRAARVPGSGCPRGRCRCTPRHEDPRSPARAPPDPLCRGRSGSDPCHPVRGRRARTSTGRPSPGLGSDGGRPRRCRSRSDPTTNRGCRRAAPGPRQGGPPGPRPPGDPSV